MSAFCWQKIGERSSTRDPRLFVRTAQRRVLAIRAFEALGLGAAVAGAGLVCLLLAGTQVLDWYWPLLLGAAGVVAGLARAARRRMSDYRLAQVLDERLHWEDRLSTAVYFGQQPDHSPAVEIVQSQLQPLLDGADVRQAVPLKVPTAVYAAAALAAVAAGLLGVRYGLMQTLDLRRPLANINLDTFLAPPKKVEAATTRKSAIQEQLEQQLQDMGMQVGDTTQDALEPQQVEAPAAEGEPGSKPAPGRQNTTADPESNTDGKQEQAASESGEEQGDPKSAESPRDDRGQQPGKGAQQRADAKNNESLMNRMRDALANLLSKMKQSGAQDGAEQQASAQQQNSQQPGRQQDQNQANTPGQGRSPSDAQTNAQESGQSPDAQSQQMAGQKGQPGDKSADQPGNQSAKSGMGSQEGDKQIREAEQLAAMGKISEIFGKRAQQITGEMTVEVSSGNQQLKTAYSGKEAAHSDTGAEVHRDVIPLAYQTYIQRYYEELRKQDAKLKN